MGAESMLGWTLLIAPEVAGILFGLSVLCFVGGLFVAFGYNLCVKNHKLSFENRMLFFSALILVATWLLRYMVGISGVFGEETLSRGEEIVNSVIHALQSFSLDEGYTEYVLSGKEMFAVAFPSNAWLPSLYGAYASLLNVVCPVAGGAILLTILTSLFPKIRLWLASLCFWRPVCYFSELNDASLALAQSIRNSDGDLRRALLIFSDVYPSSEDEAVSERIQKAKFINAVCVQEDLDNISICRRGKKKFFLMDTAEIGNLQALAGFTEEQKYTKLQKSDEIYLFCQSDSNVQVEEKVRGFLTEKLGASGVPGIIPVKDYQNLVCNLLQELPLFTALDPKAKDKTLRVTVFGTGAIGTEMFLNTYWCGQLLDRRLRIHMISKEKEADFRARIDHINPDILASMDPDAELLRVYSGGEKRSPVYCELTYTQMDVCRDDLFKMMTEGGVGDRLVDSDYFVVALGSDEDNLEIANLVGRYVTVCKADAGKAKAPVAYVIYDDKLAAALGSESADESLAVRMYPFGALSEVYDYSRIVFDGISDVAKRISDTYHETIHNTSVRKDKLIKDRYAYWANLGRAIHIQYKAFCVGLDIDRYKEMACAEKQEDPVYHRLAWLEHRRWNAFMRAKGFRAPTLEEERNYIGRLPDGADNGGKHKSLLLKLHPCLVECDDIGMKKDVFTPHSGKDDRLDEASRRMKEAYSGKKLKPYDFKTYDYPQYDF